MTLREKIGQLLAPHQWDVFGKMETNYDGGTCDMDEVRAHYEKEQFGTLRGERVGVCYLDPRHSMKLDGGTTEGLLAYGNIKIPTAPYKKYLEEISGWMKLLPLVGGDFATGADNVFEDLTRIVNANAIGAADSEEGCYNLSYTAEDVVPETRRISVEIARWCMTLVCDRQ